MDESGEDEPRLTAPKSLLARIQEVAARVRATLQQQPEEKLYKAPPPSPSGSIEESLVKANKSGALGAILRGKAQQTGDQPNSGWSGKEDPNPTRIIDISSLQGKK